MSKKDKESLLIVCFLLGYVAIALVLYFTSQAINPYILAGMITLVQVFILHSAICKYYYEAMGASIGYSRFIPIYNEIAVMPPAIATTTLVLWVIACLLFLLSLVRVDVYSSLFGMHFGMNITFHLIQGLAGIYLVLLIVRGIGWCKVTSKVQDLTCECYGIRRKFKVTTALSYFAYFIPIGRAISMVFLYNNLHRLCKLNNFDATKQEEKW